MKRDYDAPVLIDMPVPAVDSRAGLVARGVAWLERHALICGLFAIGYLVAVTLLHDLMQQPAYWAQGQLSHRSWNRLVTLVSAPILVVFCIGVVWSLRRHPHPGTVVVYVAITVLLAIASFRTLLVMNIEVIHFPQYAILVCLLFPLRFRYGETVVWATLGALIDEGYQYFYLYADRRIHFDFNDIILNTIGAGFGVVLLLTALPARPPGHRMSGSAHFARFVVSPACVATWAALLGCGVLYGLGRLRLLPLPAGSDAWAIVLRRGGPSSAFWTHTDWGKTYHDVQPLEWLLITAVLVGIYFALDVISPVKPRR